MSIIYPHSQYDTNVFNVRKYGATGNGSTDDTPYFINAINAAINSRTSNILGAVIYVPQGYYRITETLEIRAGLQLLGDAVRGSVLYFAPTKDDTCIQMGSLTSNQDKFNTVKNIEIRSATATYNKVGIHIIDCSEALIDHCYIRFADAPKHLDDRGIVLAGRESVTVSNCGIYAPVPIHICDTSGVGSDNCNFENMYLVSIPEPTGLTRACVLIDPTTNASHISFTGRQAWARGDYALVYNCDTSSANFPSLRLSNIRYEQATANDTYSFNFDCVQGGLKVTMDNCKTSPEHGGIFARSASLYLRGCDIKRNSSAGATAESLNVSGVQFVAEGCRSSDNGSFDFNSNAKCTLRTQPTASENVTSSQFPPMGIWNYPSASNTAPNFACQNGVYRYSTQLLIPSGLRHAIPVNQGNGVIAGMMTVFAWDDEKNHFAGGTFAIWDGDLDGGGRGVKMLTNTTDMSAAPNNANTINVWTGAASTGTVYIQNKISADMNAIVDVMFKSTTKELGNDYALDSAIA